MIRRTEKYFIKEINKIGGRYYGTQKIKRTTFWLLFIIPIYSKDEVISGQYEV